VEQLVSIAPLVGIAKMAANSPTLETKRATTYLELPTRSYMSRIESGRMMFRWGINPYRGCEFGCKYCYARYTHEFMELRDPAEFEHRIFAKEFRPEKFRAELNRLEVGETLALGTATDPYQPAERRFRVTRRMLEVLATTAGFRVGIITKSDLVARDADVLREISRRHVLSVNLTITSIDRDLARLTEPLAPRPDLRLDAVRTLSGAGIRTFVFCAPVMPLINDSHAALRALAQAAHVAGAAGFGANVLFLKPCAKQVFLPFIEERFPHLLRRYRERYARHAYLSGAYPETIRQRVAEIRREFWPRTQPEPEPEMWPQDQQMKLFV
jgi:DNA repair photolyase